MVSRRRQSTEKGGRERASERGRGKLEASVDRRFARLDSILTNLQRTLETQSKRTAALQAQIDYLDARVRGN
jgi:hypothetical protein